MYLKERASGDLVEVLDLAQLFDPFVDKVPGRYHVGQEMQDESTFEKAGLVFPSNEELPACWRDPDYRSRCEPS